VSTNDVAASISSKGLLFKMYRDHLGEIPVEVTGNSPQKPVDGTVRVDIPAETSGSPTYPLDMIATLNKDKTKLTIALVNPMLTGQEIQIDFGGSKIGKNAKTWTLAAASLQTENKPGEPPVIDIKERVVKTTPKIKVLPLSITIYEVNLLK
jgi:alpha-N-arabinofuranosidase